MHAHQKLPRKLILGVIERMPDGIGLVRHLERRQGNVKRANQNVRTDEIVVKYLRA
jgi:hypothetical protein